MPYCLNPIWYAVAHRIQDWVGHNLGKNLPKTVVPLRRFEKREKTREGHESQDERTWEGEGVE